jgi:hypothetical protein
MLTNREDNSQPPAISQAPPAGADGGDSPSQLLAAFIDYLRARPTMVDSEAAQFDNGSSELEGVRRDGSELGGVPTITLEPQAGRPARTVLYFHGGGYVSGSPQIAIFRWPPRWLWQPTPECTSWTIGLLQKPLFRAPLTIAYALIGG